ncbi:MAG TPA: hypothetical protein VHA12_01810 [Candidatus Nanoarchaeia archaeon]|nr:hypothetical protein [Candidatus Nanoarchaeia archaeon]
MSKKQGFKEIKKDIKVTEIKKDIKITELKKENKLQVNLPLEKEVKSKDRNFNSLIQKSLQKNEPSVAIMEKEQVREELRNKEKELSYISTVQASLDSPKSYDPSIKSESTSFERFESKSISSSTRSPPIIKEIKKDMKVTEIKTNRLENKRELESKVNLETDFPILSRQGARVSPTLSQESTINFNRKTPEQVREELRNKDKEFSYLSTVQAANSTTRSYDPSIKSGSAFFESGQRAERINPTISSSPLQEVQSRSSNIRDALNQGSLEPGLRNFNDQGKEYKTQRVEKYVAKRRND